MIPTHNMDVVSWQAAYGAPQALSHTLAAQPVLTGWLNGLYFDTISVPFSHLFPMASHTEQLHLETASFKSLLGHNPKLQDHIQDALQDQKDKGSTGHHSTLISKLILNWRRAYWLHRLLCVQFDFLTSGTAKHQWSWVCKIHEHRLQSTSYPEAAAHHCLYQPHVVASLRGLKIRQQPTSSNKAS